MVEPNQPAPDDHGGVVSDSDTRQEQDEGSRDVQPKHNDSQDEGAEQVSHPANEDESCAVPDSTSNSRNEPTSMMPNAESVPPGTLHQQPPFQPHLICVSRRFAYSIINLYHGMQ